MHVLSEFGQLYVRPNEIVILQVGVIQVQIFTTLLILPSCEIVRRE